MNIGLKPYPSMKESATSWLATIPGSWRTSKLRQCVRFVGGLTPSMEDRSLWDGDVPWVTPKDMKRPAIGESILRVSNKALGTTGLRLIPAGSVLMVVRGMILARRVPVAWTTHPVTVNQDMKALVPKPSVNARFLALQLEAASDGLNPMIDEAGHGTRRLPTERLRELAVVLPSEEEQTAIVRFLDHADRRIRRYIRAKQNLIALLEEQKQAIIHRAVTRGLEPSVPLKPSGVNWLGGVPEHWAVARLKQLVTESVAGPYGSSLTKAMYTLSGYRVYGQQQVIADDFTVGDYFISSNQFQRMRQYRVAPGDVLVSAMGTIGRAAVVPDDAEPGIINPRLVRYRPDLARVRPRFLQLAITSSPSRSQLVEEAKGTTMDGLNMRSLGRLRIVVPSLAEQDRILEWVADATRDSAVAVRGAQLSASLLREYRTRLIADVVTGQVDVREAAARLPNEGSDRETLDELDPSSDGEDEELADHGVAEEAGA